MQQAVGDRAFFLSVLVFLSSSALSASAQVTATKGYSVSVFATGTDKYTQPDSIAVAHGNVFVGFGGPGLPDGSDGKSSYIIEYSKSGQQEHVYTVLGHNDGLKLNPDDGKLYAMQNEDANPNLVIIDPATRQQSVYYFAAKPPHGGGYDDMVFRNHKLYISCSNPAHNPNAAPAIVEATFDHGMIAVKEVLSGTAAAITVPTGTDTTLNLQDPDSMTLDAEGDLFLDSQGDSEVLIVRQPQTDDQTVLQLPLSSPFGTPQIDDTLFIPANKGYFLVADTPANKVYAISKKALTPGVAYSAGQGAADAQGNMEGFVGRLDLDSGYITPIATGFQSPHGMSFVLTDSDEGK